MMLYEVRKFPNPFFMLLTQRHEFCTPKLFSKSPYLTVNIKINYETGCIGRFSEKKTKRCIQDHRDS